MLILGSKSPRRQEILAMAGYKFKVVVSDIDENVCADSITDMSLKIAKKKCDAIFKDYKDDIVVCADTIVVINDIVLGKPKDKADARYMINMIQGKCHEVYTSVIVKAKGFEKEFLEKTKVYVRNMTSAEIEEYINMTEPYDKAGAYAIQGYFAKYIEAIDGDYYNVMGLPICSLSKILDNLKEE
ncbi:MAG: septum formation protein Maf [Bacilli bacterium]|nr:septum formation protein Maf [Bacilli bacterium]